MSVSVAGLGWVTPLGSGINEVWEQLLAGNTPQAQEVRDTLGRNAYPVFRVPAAALKNLPAHPRLRRASAISRFAAAAGLAALHDANLTPNDAVTRRMALIFAVANGGVIYTKRFYGDIVNTGADAASPLLFPETVFNAAASHLAAIIGLSGTSYTLVGDGAIGLSAIKMGEDLLADQDLDYCLIVAAEEADWLLCDAYQKWRLLRSAPPLELFGRDSKGTILSEGAGAVLLGRTGPTRIAATAAGAHFTHRTGAAAALQQALTQIGGATDAIVISSANGTFIDKAETNAIKRVLSRAIVYSPKAALGEGVAASALWQVIVAVQALRTQQLPCAQYFAPDGTEPAGRHKWSNNRELIVLSCGLNQQAGASRLVSEPGSDPPR